MQSIATAAGYMTAPLISSLAAYMMVTDTVIPMATTIVWIIARWRCWACCSPFRSNGASSMTSNIRFPKAGRPAW